jgi:hypothetical protein
MNRHREMKEIAISEHMIFGHGGCLGDVGHCDIKPCRPEHPLTPALKMVVAIDALRKIPKSTDTITVTIVPIIAKGDMYAENHD